MWLQRYILATRWSILTLKDVFFISNDVFFVHVLLLQLPLLKFEKIVAPLLCLILFLLLHSFFFDRTLLKENVSNASFNSIFKQTQLSNYSV